MERTPSPEEQAEAARWEALLAATPAEVREVFERHTERNLRIDAAVRHVLYLACQNAHALPAWALVALHDLAAAIGAEGDRHQDPIAAVRE